MRIYLNCLEAITDIGRELKKCSSVVHTQTMQNKVIADNPEFATHEIEAFDFAILNSSDKDEMPNVTLEWCKAEFEERVSPEQVNPGKAFYLRPEVWNQFLNEEGLFDYTYSQRMHFQIQDNIKELREHPETRQAIIQVHNRSIDQFEMGKKRIPCSMFYQFLKREGKLDIIYIMRSSDFATHFQNDIWLAMELQKYIASETEIPVGKFIMFVSSLHIYRKDWNLLERY